MTTPDDPRFALAEMDGAIDPTLIGPHLTEAALTDPQAQEREFAELRRRYPRQFRSGRADGGAGRGSTVPGPVDMNTLLRDVGRK